MGRDDFVAALSSWNFSPLVLLWLSVVAVIYLRGWLVYRRRRSSRFGVKQLTCFISGLVVVAVALQSPLDALASLSLQVHMVQHLLLMIVAPPLVLLGQPMLPMIAGLPRSFRKNWVTPFATWKPLRRTVAKLFHPVSAWCMFVVTLWVWHSPHFYGLALQSEGWHRIEHACFLTTSMLFWWPVMQPFPTTVAWSRWLMVPYLVLAGVQGTALAGVLTFANHVLYSHYEVVPNIWGIDPLTDQALAGAIMWVPMSLAFLVSLVCVVGGMFVTRAKPALDADNKALVRKSEKPKRQTYSATSLMNAAFAQKSTRRILRGLMLLLTGVVIIDGVTGPPVSPLNLAGVLPWIHWRGVLVLTLLVGGNFFCMVCPFTTLQRIVSAITSRLGNLIGTSKWWRLRLPQKRHWPRGLQSKWLAIGVLVFFFWSYEAFALWDRPFATAIIAIGFFAAVLASDAIFLNAPFCKFVCPIGQFNFVQSLVSPTQIAVANASTCDGCRTKDCISGNATSNGCQTLLFQPRKSGNMDCTFCFDCVDACPHDNVALVQINRTVDLADDRKRSGIGRYSQRPDLAAMIALLFFAAFVNAAWMTAPVIQWEERVVDAVGIGRLPVMTAAMLVALCVVPVAIMSVVAWFSNRGNHQTLNRSLLSDQAPASSTATELVSNVNQFAPSLIPLGFGMWLAHYSFHLFTSYDSAWVAGKRMLSDWTGASFEVGPIACACCKADSIPWLLPLEFGFLGVGLCVSLVVGYRISQREVTTGSWIPWFGLMVAFYASCAWVLLQPMQMRGAAMVGI